MTKTLQEKQSAAGKRTLAAIFIVALLPVALAYFAFYTGIGVPKGTVNEGVLLDHPVHVRALFEDSSSDALTVFEQNRKWRLLIPVGTACDKACQDLLYTTRQVHIRLGDKSGRLARHWINLGAEEGEHLFTQYSGEHPRLTMFGANKQKWQAWLADSATSLDIDTEPYYLLVDQEGFAIMYYTVEQHGNQLLKDIKKVLKSSIDYR